MTEPPNGSVASLCLVFKKSLFNLFAFFFYIFHVHGTVRVALWFSSQWCPSFRSMFFHYQFAIGTFSLCHPPCIYVTLISFPAFNFLALRLMNHPLWAISDLIWSLPSTSKQPINEGVPMPLLKLLDIAAKISLNNHPPPSKVFSLALPKQLYFLYYV